jgi:hypothetical protein
MHKHKTDRLTQESGQTQTPPHPTRSITIASFYSSLPGSPPSELSLIFLRIARTAQSYSQAWRTLKSGYTKGIQMPKYLPGLTGENCDKYRSREWTKTRTGIRLWDKSIIASLTLKYMIITYHVLAAFSDWVLRPIIPLVGA